MEDKKWRILIIDDDHIYRVVLSELLRKAGCQIASMFSVEQALQFFHQTPLPPIDLIILDYQMPELSGIQALEKFSALPEIKPIPVIMITARAGQEERKAALKYGIKDFLFKPVEKALLLKTIHQVLTEAL